MTERNKTVKTVEEAIQILAYNEHFWDGFGPHAKDVKTIKSLAEAPYAYTEKQGKLAVALLKRYHTLFQKYNIDLTHLFDRPVFREPFRVIDYAKSIERYTEDDRDWIEMKFPYDSKIIELIRSLKEKTDRMVPAIYHGEQKKWQIACTEITLYYCVLIAVRYDFKFVTPEILDDFEEIKKEKLSYKPTVAKLRDGSIVLDNAAQSLTDWWQENYINKNFIHQCDVLKELEIENTINFETTEHSTLADRIAICKGRELIVDRNKWTKTEFINALEQLQSLPAIVVMGNELTDYREVKEVLDWCEAAKSVGFQTEQLAWGFTVDDAPDWRRSQTKDTNFTFRDPYPVEAPEHKREEMYDRWNELQIHSRANRHVDQNTKIIFVRTRLPRTLIKSGIKPKSVFTVFDTALWPTATETMGRVVDNLPKRIYYITVGKKTPLWTEKKYELV